MAKKSIFQRVSLPVEPTNRKDWLAVKFPSGELNTGSVLEVPPGTVALVVHAGKIEKVFENGTHKLSTENIPVIKTFTKALFGGEIPFTMDIYYINRTAQHEFFWGTPTPITVESMAAEDMGITYNFGARGSYYLRIKHYQFFFEWILGSLAYGEFVYWSNVADRVKNYINPLVIEFLSNYVYDNKISYGRIQAMATPCSNAIMESLKPKLESSFGLEFQSFNTIIAIDQKDRDAFNEARKEAQRAAQQGRLNDVTYNRGVQQRQLDVMEGAANNEGGLGGLMGAGIGLGAGLTMMGQAGNINNAAANPQGGTNNPTITCPQCNAQVPAGSNFCPKCGQSLAAQFCSNCGAKVAPGSAFCSKCGNKIGG